MEECPLATAWRLPEVDDASTAARSLRVALFCGNYNYVRDGSNQALNRLVAFLEREGCTVRVYSPTSDTPAFPPAGTLVSVPSVRIPFRGEFHHFAGFRVLKAPDVPSVLLETGYVSNEEDVSLLFSDSGRRRVLCYNAPHPRRVAQLVRAPP